MSSVDQSRVENNDHTGARPSALTQKDPLGDLVRRHKAGEPIGLTSVCSAHPMVLEAAVLHARDGGGHALIEATSNQVDQDGGYTGMRPEDFRDLVLSTAERCGLPPARVVLGGDHLGPNRWRHLSAEEAMSYADRLVEAYVAAGFTKIHLDCSFSCAGDPRPLTDELVSQRAARLMRVAEDTAALHGTSSALRYVIGTEVPVPGGARDGVGDLVPTWPGAARETLRCHRDEFAAQGLMDVWPRVMALVVQPGVEFDHLHVVDYARDRTTELRRVLDDEPDMIFEAHSTDYQTTANLQALVEDHWVVLKVGPGLTFALREAMFSLAAIEAEVVDEARRSGLKDVIEARMLAQPGHWEGYYTGDDREQHLARLYSYSDRLRYYWPDPEVHKAQERLLNNLSTTGIPLPLLSQYLPDQYARVRDGEVSPQPRALVIDHVRDVLRSYARASKETSS
jgi:D-tagatose-1,6-bisphosphate aldolase subunit GatZ/KbaZ